jgi:hypothetical protein
MDAVSTTGHRDIHAVVDKETSPCSRDPRRRILDQCAQRSRREVLLANLDQIHARMRRFFNEVEDGTR